jgi:isopentenyl diphosphate isomerase/L-lactate dehydrogenase-like FMN-dependent dehydrogenase
VEDAKLALNAGCDGIIVSNHGGKLTRSRRSAVLDKLALFCLTMHRTASRWRYRLIGSAP